MASTPSRIRRFASELRRRKVLRVAAAYGVVALAVAEAANNVLPPLGMDAGPRIVVVLLLAGFPITIALSWLFDITPRGIERTPALEAESVRVPLPAGSIAVLPLVNLGGDPAQDYLSDGLTEEMIVALSGVPGLRVAARTSCFAMKGSTEDVRAIGRRLGVRHVIDGGVRTSGNRLRLAIQLVDVESGYAEWSETYERQLDDLFSMQRDVAHAIVERVSAGTREAKAAVAGPGTQNLEAFHLLLRGRHHWNRRTEPDLREAIRYFEQAVAADPDFARAWAGLADALSLLLDYGGIPWAEGMPRARDAAERALRLDDSLAEAWTSLALVRGFEWRWADADRCFTKSIELRPDYPTAHQRFALQNAWLRRPEQAIHHARLAETLDPFSTTVVTSTAFVLYYARRHEEARTQALRAIEMDAGFATAHIVHGLVCMQLADPEAAVRALANAAKSAGPTAAIRSLESCALAMAGRSKEAEAVRESLESQAGQHVTGYYRALPLLLLDNVDGALEALEAACDEHAAQIAYIGVEPLLDGIRPQPRFRALLRRAGLDDAEPANDVRA